MSNKKFKKDLSEIFDIFLLTKIQMLQPPNHFVRRFNKSQINFEISQKDFFSGRIPVMVKEPMNLIFFLTSQGILKKK